MFFCRSTSTQSVIVQPNRLSMGQHTTIYIHTSMRPPPLFSTVESPRPRSAPSTSERACQADTRSQQRNFYDNVRPRTCLQRSYQCFCPREFPAQYGVQRYRQCSRAATRIPNSSMAWSPGTPFCVTTSTTTNT